MKLAFYKAFSRHGTWKEIAVDMAIGVFSAGRYSHVELVFRDNESFSVSPRDGGARFKRFNYHPDRWDFVDIKLTHKEIREIRQKANRMSGMKYDYFGAFFSITPFCIQKSSRLFCSEALVNLLQGTKQFGGMGDGCKYSPSRMYAKIKSIKNKRRHYARNI